MPRFDQSGRRQVRRVISKISTPVRMAAMMAGFDSWKACSSSADHKNLQRGLRNGLNGAMMSRS